MKLTKSACLAAAITLALSSASFATLTHAEGMNLSKKQIHKLVKKLDLTEEQQAVLKSLRDEKLAKHQEMKANRKAFRESLQQLVKAEEFDENAVRALFSENQNNLIEARVEKARGKHEFWNTLTAEQQDKLSEMKPKMRNHKMANRPFKQIRILRKLDLTDDQKSQVRGIMRVQVANIDPFDETRKQTMDSIKALVQTDSFNESAVAAVITDAFHSKNDKMIEKLKVRNQVWNLLTAEQQEKFEEIKQKFANKRRQHKEMI